MNNILALDIATKTGWAMCADDVTSGVLDLKPFEDEAARADSFEDWLRNKIIANNITHVAIESVIGLRWGGTAYRLYGLHCVAHLVCYRHKVARQTVSPPSLKKYVTGSGRAKKKDMIEAVRGWGFNPLDDNEADAIALLTYAREFLANRVKAAGMQ